MKREVKNHSASVHRQLLDKAKQSSRPFNQLLQYYAAERFLYRFSQSKHRDKAVLKGAMMFIVWNAPYARATRDIDMLGILNNSMDNVTDMVKSICVTTVPSDGLSFDPGTVKGEQIIEDGDYKGVRVKFQGFLGNARVSMQIDFGFGDIVFPKAQEIEYPTMLDMPAPKLKGYPKETVIAEKFHTMMNLGIINSRMKDFYDIWLLIQQFDFHSGSIEQAIRKTFKNRKTTITSPIGLFERIKSEKEKDIQWKAFIRKSGLHTVPDELGDIIHQISSFMIPITDMNPKEKSRNLAWHAPGPWREA